MKDELGQVVAEKPLFLSAVSTHGWLCACCGQSLAAHQWTHQNVQLKRGYYEMECLNSGCEQNRKVMRIPLEIHHFPVV
jgi:hypothetical protein